MSLWLQSVLQTLEARDYGNLRTDLLPNAPIQVPTCIIREIAFAETKCPKGSEERAFPIRVLWLLEGNEQRVLGMQPLARSRFHPEKLLDTWKKVLNDEGFRRELEAGGFRFDFEKKAIELSIGWVLIGETFIEDFLEVEKTLGIEMLFPSSTGSGEARTVFAKYKADLHSRGRSSMPEPIVWTRPDGTSIHSINDWPRPKRPDLHWKAGRSAMELAHAWFRGRTGAPPAELMQLMKSVPDLKDLVVEKAMPELVTGLPERGEGRNHDLWLLARTAREQVTVCIEAKADEPFGNDTVGGYHRKAMARRTKGVATKVPERIARLLKLVPGDTADWDGVRFQLLAAICGTALQAAKDGSRTAILVVHEFRTGNTQPKRLAKNAADYEKFIHVLTGCPSDHREGVLHGPFGVAGVPCYTGKVVTLISAPQ